MSEFRLIQEILARSNSNNWDEAKTEWKLIEIIEAEEPETCLCGHYPIIEAEEPETCLCGHYPIIELCELRNTMNGKGAVVGNHCVKKFMGISSDKIFASVKKVRSDIEKSVNIETILFLSEKGLISDWEKSFYADTHRKRKLSDKQIEKRIEINKKVLQIVKKKGI